MIVSSIEIRAEYLGKLNSLPYSVSPGEITLSWLVDGVRSADWACFCLELKSRQPIAGNNDYIYWTSGLVYSTSSCYGVPKTVVERFSGEVVEVRLRLFDKRRNLLYSTHEAISRNEYLQFPDIYNYPFEGTEQQGYKWDSLNDKFYMLIDPVVENLIGVSSPVISWTKPEDEDLSQNLSYQLQWSLTPLFDEGMMGKDKTDHTTVIDVGENQLSVTADIRHKAAIFYRVRAFDGLDYGEWSQINGFNYSPELAPSCKFLNVVTNSTLDNPNNTLRPNGEVSISFIVNDFDSETVSAYLTYKFKLNGQACDANGNLLYGGAEIEYPCTTKESLISIVTNKPVQAEWLSALQFPDTVFPKTTLAGKLDIFISLYADDGNNRSLTVTWAEPLIINNYDNSGSGGGAIGMSANMLISSRAVSHDRWIHAPSNEVTQTNSLKGNDDNYIVNWAEYWRNHFGQEVYDSAYVSNQDDILQYVDNKVKKPSYRIYDGYDENERTDAGLLYLEDKDEVDARNEKRKQAGNNTEEKFHVYFDNKEQGRADLGRGIDNVQFFIPGAKYSPAFNIRRPTVVNARHSGLYLHGLSPLNQEMDYYTIENTGDDETEETPFVKSVKAMKGGFNWSQFLQLDRMYAPKADIVERRVGVFDGSRIHYDDEVYRSWTLFEYNLNIRFPVSIERDVNDSYAWKLNNGIDFWQLEDGKLMQIPAKPKQNSLLLDGEDYLFLELVNGELPERFSDILNLLFPYRDEISIFQSPRIEIIGNTARVNIYSLQSDALKTFVFEDVPGDCYMQFGIDRIERFSYGQQYNSYTEEPVTGRKYTVSNQISAVSAEGDDGSEDDGGEKKSVTYDIPPDEGCPIDYEDDCLNTTEPLFTCDPIHVNKFGCHYKYSDKRFQLSGKVYLRKYKTATAYPFKSDSPLRDRVSGETEAPKKEYKNYTLKFVSINDLGEELYIKEFDNSIGGIVPIVNPVFVEFEGQIIEDKGYWEPVADSVYDPEACITHEPCKKNDEYKLDENGNILYARKSPSDFISEMSLTTVYYAEYTEIEEGWYHPVLEGTNSSVISTGQAAKISTDAVTGKGGYIYGPYKTLENQTPSRIAEGYREELGTENGRAQNLWANFDDSYDEITVEQSIVEVSSREKTTEKYGYVSNLETDKRFKESKDWEGRIIPEETNYVHGIYRESNITIADKGLILKNQQLISDASKIQIPASEGIAVDWADYALKGAMPLNTLSYDTGIQSDKNSKNPVYKEAKPLRNLGNVDIMSEILPWNFIYLQDEWNCYNMIHWEGTQDELTKAKIEVAEIDDFGVAGEYKTLKTKSSVWNDSSNSWLIPYSKAGQFDCLDTLNTVFESIGQNGERQAYRFEDGKKYRFKLTAINMSQSISGTSTYSKDFVFSKTASAPPVITDVTYNKWTKQITLTFRIDDFYGRNYDLTNFRYAAYEEGSSSPKEADFIELGLDILAGKLRNLLSNKNGDSIPPNSSIITHQVSFTLDAIEEDITGKNVRFQIDAVPSDEREGVDLPVFSFTMWANEELKKAEDRENAIAGYVSRWKHSNKLDEDGQPVFDEDGVALTEWTYLPKEDAVIVPGVIKDCENRLNLIQSEFETWYQNMLKFSGDCIVARLTYVSTKNLTSELEQIVFSQFLTTWLGDWKETGDDRGLSSLWYEFTPQYEDLSDTGLRKLFLAEYELSDDFRFYYESHVCKYIADLQAWSERNYQKWLNDRLVAGDDILVDNFIDAYKLEENYNNYISDNDLENLLESKLLFIDLDEYSGDYLYYKDMANKYSWDWYNGAAAYINDNWSSEYTAWLENPVFEDGTSAVSYADSDINKIRLFINSNRQIWNTVTFDRSIQTQYFSSESREVAYSDFLRMSKNGISYGQQIRVLNNEIQSAVNELYDIYDTEARLEKEFRSRLIRAHYFCNGWKNNQPFVSGNSKNEVFRYRVENNAVTGLVNNEYEKIGSSQIGEILPGYDPRWEVYFQLQVDFNEGFDSQPGNRPLLDYSYTRNGELSDDTYSRITGGIAAEEGMNILPGQAYNSSSEKYAAKTNVTPATKQFHGTFSIPRDELPGCMPSDTLPANFSNYECTYFWRVRPYNIVPKPQMAKERIKLAGVEFDGFNDCTARIELSSARQYFSSCSYDGRNSVSHTEQFRICSSPYWQYGMEQYIWYSSGRLDSPRWVFDIGNDYNTSNRTNNYYATSYTGFFKGTNINRIDELNQDSHKELQSYRERLGQGEIVFLTDRPRQFVNGELEFVTADVNQYKNLLLPADYDRKKPSLIYCEQRREWIMTIQKRKSTLDNDLTENVIVICRGASQQTFGEDVMIFPDTMRGTVSDCFSSLRPGAYSAENPFLTKQGGKYAIYFNLLCDDGNIETWRIESADSCEWGNLSKINLPDTVKEPSVYYDDIQGSWLLYGIVSNNGLDILREYTSNDGINFALSRNLFSDFGLSRPTIAMGRIWFEIKSNSFGKIVSMELDGADLRTELGYACPDLMNNAVFNNEDCRHSPFVFEDYDKGVRVARIVYEMNGPVYAYVNDTCQRINNLEESHLYTMFLEEYDWKQTSISEITLPDGTIISSNLGNQTFPSGIINVKFPCSIHPEAVKVAFSTVEGYEDLETYGDWVDFNNVGKTDAVISPGLQPDNYDINSRTPKIYIDEHDLTEAFNLWAEAHPELANADNYGQFLIENDYWGKYLKWQRKGPFTFNYSNSLKRTSYPGDGG